MAIAHGVFCLAKDSVDAGCLPITNGGAGAGIIRALGPMVMGSLVEADHLLIFFRCALFFVNQIPGLVKAICGVILVGCCLVEIVFFRHLSLLLALEQNLIRNIRL